MSPRRRKSGQWWDKTEKIITKADWTKCYVNNLPTDISVREGERRFERWGRVVNVYIARRRNNMGICFRFLRYTSIKGEEWLEKQLRDVWFGSYKVWVNISRFARTTRNQSNKDRIYNDEKEERVCHMHK